MRVSNLTAALAIGLFGAQLAGAEDMLPRMIRIHCEVFELGADREKTLRSRSEVPTAEGTPAGFQSGRGDGLLAVDDERNLQITNSIECAIAPYCLKNGKVKLDIECAATRPIAKEDRKDDGVLAHKLGMRLVRTAAWGERIVVPLRNSAGESTHTIEIVVTEEVDLPRAELEPDDVPPAPLRRRRFDFDVGGVPFRPAPGPGIR